MWKIKHALHLLWFLFMWLHLETRFLPFFLWILNVFYFGTLKFQSFNFLLITLGVFNFFVWNFTKGKKGYLLFFLWTLKIFCFGILKFYSFQFSSYEFWRFFVLVFWNSRIFIFLLIILRVFHFFVWSLTRGERGYLPFFLWTLKDF
jgi:hypothetical protein